MRIGLEGLLFTIVNWSGGVSVSYRISVSIDVLLGSRHRKCPYVVIRYLKYLMLTKGYYICPYKIIIQLA